MNTKNVHILEDASLYQSHAPNLCSDSFPISDRIETRVTLLTMVLGGRGGAPTGLNAGYAFDYGPRWSRWSSDRIETRVTLLN
ncbi:hypothetical protein YC2023_005441 [Brassica napus]